MTTIRANLISGTVAENPLGSGTLTLTMAGDLTNLPSVGGGNIARLIIDPEGVDVLVGSGPEIVHITAYTQGAGSATVARGQEGFSAKPHSQGVKIIHAPTTADWDEKADLTGATFTGGVNLPHLHVAGNADIDGAGTFAGIHVTGTAVIDGATTFNTGVQGPDATFTHITTAQRIAALGGIGVPQGYVGGTLADSTANNRLIYHDSANIYIGDIDNQPGAAHQVLFRTAGADRFGIDAAGAVRFYAQPGTTHESLRVDSQPTIARGFSAAADGAVHQGAVNFGLSVAINRATPAAVFNNQGGDSLRCYAGSTQTLAVASDGTASFSGWVGGAATGPNSVSFRDNDNHYWESDGAGGWRFANRWSHNGAIFRFYGGSAFDELTRFAGVDGAFKTAMFLAYRDNGGTAYFSQVFAIHDASFDGIIGPNGHILYVTHA